MGQDDKTHKADDDLQGDLELSDQDAEQVTGGSTGRIVTNPPPVVSVQMDVKP